MYIGHERRLVEKETLRAFNLNFGLNIDRYTTHSFTLMLGYKYNTETTRLK